MGTLYNLDTGFRAIADNSYSQMRVYFVSAVANLPDTCGYEHYLYVFFTEYSDYDTILADFIDCLYFYEESRWSSLASYGTYPSIGVHIVHSKDAAKSLRSITFYNIDFDKSLPPDSNEFVELFFERKRTREAKSERYKQYLELKKEFEGK